MLFAVVPLCALFAFAHQAPSPSGDGCVCELTGSEQAFPHGELRAAEGNAADCNANVTQRKITELESLLLGLGRRLPQLEADVAALERESDGELFSVLSLQVIENEMKDVLKMIDKLNATTRRYRDLAADTTKQLEDLRGEMDKLQKYDTLQVVKREQANTRLRRDLDQCRIEHRAAVPPTRPSRGNCPHGTFLNVTGPRVYTAGEYPGSYKYGAWGRDPKPEEGKESWYWMVPLTSSNRYANYVRFYGSLSALIVGVSVPGNVQIHSSNPTTNTIQGPNVVVYGGALYYNCYNQDDVCRFNLTTKTVTTLKLPKGTRYNSKGNYCHLDECYAYTDLDLATDESGVWVIYSTSDNFGNLVLSELEAGPPMALGRTWRTSVYKQGVSNAFVACGVLYAARYAGTGAEEIFYSLDTATGAERFDVGIRVPKTSANVLSLNYSPVDQMLHAYSDAYMVSYKVLYG